MTDSEQQESHVSWEQFFILLSNTYIKIHWQATPAIATSTRLFFSQIYSSKRDVYLF